MIVFQRRRALRREKVFRDRSQVLDWYTNDELISRYRFFQKIDHANHRIGEKRY
jgi:hypothetical protein